MGLADNTLTAYRRGLEEYLGFCAEREAEPTAAGKSTVAAYVRYLLTRPKDRGEGVLANATVQQRITVVRLFYDYLVEERVREDNPVARGRYTPGNSFGGKRGLVYRYKKLPWIPSEEQWSAVLATMRRERLRNRLMLAFAYDAALRREELCALRTDDIDPSGRLIRVRAETTKGRWERVVPYSEPTGELYRAYLPARRVLSRHAGPLFLSESRRNRGQPLTIWTWSKAVRTVAKRSGVERFTTHTPRHLCLTDLARSGWDIHEIANFAGHRSTETTLQYIHLSGRDLRRRLELGMQQIHSWRVRTLAEESPE